MVTTQTADNALKSYYLDIVSDQLNLSANPLLAKIGRTTADVWGKDVRKLVRYGVTATTLLWILPYVVCGLLVGAWARKRARSLPRAETDTRSLRLRSKICTAP